jgi:hypothetical protein
VDIFDQVMLFRYASPVQAEQAVARSLRLQSGQLLLSVQRMTTELAALLNLQIDARGSISEILGEGGKASMKDVSAVSDYDRFVGSNDGINSAHKRNVSKGKIGLKSGDDGFERESFERIEFNRSQSASRIGQVGAGFRSVNDPSAPDIYLKPPKKSTSICSKLMEYFFSY